MKKSTDFNSKIYLAIVFQFLSFILSAQQDGVIFKNVNIISPETDTIYKNTSILVENGFITKISNHISPKESIIVNLNGHFVTPSYSDAHIHLPNNTKEFKRILDLNLINGIVNLRSMRGHWNHSLILEDLKKDEDILPNLYLSPPPVSQGIQLNIDNTSDYFQKARNLNFDFIKVLSIGSEEEFKILDSISSAYGLTTAGHFLNNVNDSLYFNSQIKTLEHLGGLLDKDKLDFRLNEIKKNKIFIVPTLHWYYVSYGNLSIETMLNDEGMEFYNKEEKNKWATDTRKYRNDLGEIAFKEELEGYNKIFKKRLALTNDLVDNGFQLLISPDSSSKWITPGFSLFEEIMWYKKAGISNEQILDALTINYARYTNQKEYSGTVKTGDPASFVVLRGNPIENIEYFKEIVGVVNNGQYLNEEDLKRIKNSLKEGNSVAK